MPRAMQRLQTRSGGIGIGALVAPSRPPTPATCVVDLLAQRSPGRSRLLVTAAPGPAMGLRDRAVLLLCQRLWASRCPRPGTAQLRADRAVFFSPDHRSTVPGPARRTGGLLSGRAPRRGGASYARQHGAGILAAKHRRAVDAVEAFAHPPRPDSPPAARTRTRSSPGPGTGSGSSRKLGARLAHLQEPVTPHTHACLSASVRGDATDSPPAVSAPLGPLQPVPVPAA